MSTQEPTEQNPYAAPGSDEPPPVPEDGASKRAVSPHAWVASTYFAEGYPYTLVVNIPEVLFQQLGASLQAIGLTALFHLPWNLKFLWGPFLDRFETKRRWLIWVELALAGLIVALSPFVTSAEFLGVVSVLFLLMGVLSATNDIAIDGYYMEALDERGQSKFVGYRAMAYKAANLVGRGPLLILVGYVGWSVGFLVAALLMLALALLHWALLPKVETREHGVVELLRSMLRLKVLAVASAIALLIVLERQLGLFAPVGQAITSRVQAVPALAKINVPGWIAIALLSAMLLTLAMLPRIRRRIEGSDSYYARAFVDFLAQPQVGRILAFVILFRTGESFLQKMRWPFLNGELGMTLEQYGIANGTIGLTSSFVATFVGGMLISKYGLRRWIWPFVLAQNTLNLLYVGLAVWGDPAQIGMGTLTVVIAIEEFGAGLGTAVFMVYLMRCCDPAHKAAHFAILSALMSVSFTLAGVASGFLAEAIGFGQYFAFTFVATIPMMALIFVIPRLDETG